MTLKVCYPLAHRPGSHNPDRGLYAPPPTCNHQPGGGSVNQEEIDMPPDLPGGEGKLLNMEIHQKIKDRKDRIDLA